MELLGAAPGVPATPVNSFAHDRQVMEDRSRQNLVVEESLLGCSGSNRLDLAGSVKNIPQKRGLMPHRKREPL